MVDLPSIPKRLVTTEAPTSSVTAADVAAPYATLSHSLEELAGAADAFAVEEAHRQGLKAVSRDENGELKVAQIPLLIGKAKQAYERTAHQSYLAQLAPEVQAATTKAGSENEGKPQDFALWGETYVSTLAAKQPTPELQEAVRQLALRHVGQVQNGLTLRQGHRDIHNAQQALLNEQTSAQNDLLAMSRGGLGEGDAAFDSRLADWDRAQGDRRTNPAFGYTEQQAAFERRQFLSSLGASRFLHEVERIANDGSPNGGIDNALKFADGILTRTDLNLSTEERHKYWSRASSEMRALKAERTQQLNDARAAVQSLNFQTASGLPVEPAQVERIADALKKAGAPGDAARLYATYSRKSLNDDFGRQPLEEQTRQIQALTAVGQASTPRARQAYEFFVSRGYTSEQSSGIVGNLLHESGLDPTQKHDNNTGLGIAGWRGKRLAALNVFAEVRGKSATDFLTQLEFVDSELRSTEGEAMSALQSAKTPEEAGAAIVRFERPKYFDPNDVTKAHGYANRVNLSHAVSAVNTGRIADRSLALSPAGGLWLTQNRQRETDKAANGTWDLMMKEWSERQVRPADAIVSQIIDAARATGNTALLDRIADDMGRVDLVQSGGQQPLSAQHSSIVSLEAAAQSGKLAPGAAPVLAQITKRYNAVKDGLEKNPMATAAKNFSNRFDVPAALDFRNPGGLTAQLRYRAELAQFAAANWQTTPLSILDEADITALKSAVGEANGGAIAAAAVSAFSTLPPDIYRATMMAPAMRDALDGMVRSYDPVKLNWAMTTMDQLYNDDKNGFASIFKEGAVRRLQTWQARRDSMTPQQMAAYFQKADDPAEKAARDAMEKQANDKIQKLSAADIASSFGNWAERNVPFVDPPVPRDLLQAEALAVEWRGLVSERYIDTGNIDVAKKQAGDRIKMTWGPSEVGGGVLMKYPPERYYPAVGGSMNWMLDDLSKAIVPRVGKPQIEHAGDGGVALNWKAGLISDRQTEADVKNGRRPSYAVHITDFARGTIDIPFGDDGKPLRFTFDPAPYQAEARAAFEKAHGTYTWRDATRDAAAMPAAAF